MIRSWLGSDDTTTVPRGGRTLSALQAELAVGLTLVAIGVVLRVWQPRQMAVEHFDEGVYASNLLCEFNGYHFPNRHLYAPPLLPALLEWALIVSGRMASSVMWVNVIVGCLMVPSVWWVGREWFGRSAGLTAAALAAFSHVHVIFSRTALTDPLLCLCLLWGVYFAWRAVLSGLLSQVIAAAVFAALAWWTKYNGWLTLAISGTGMLAWLAFSRGGSREWRALLRWLLIAVIAVAAWLPVLIDLRPYGGYSAVAKNHAGYFVGWSGWAGSLMRQAFNLRYLEGVAGRWQTLLLIGLMIPRCATPKLWIAIFVGSAGMLLMSTHALLAMLSVIGLVLVLTESRWRSPIKPSSGGRVRSVADGPVLRNTGITESSDNRDGGSAIALAAWMLAAWFVGLLVAVPLYTPFPRLTLPWVVSAWLGTGLALAALARRSSRLDPVTAETCPRKWWSVLLQVAGLSVLAIGSQFATSGPHAYLGVRDRSGLQTAAADIHSEVLASLQRDHADGEVDAVIYVVAEPALFFHLALLARESSPQLLVVLPSGEVPQPQTRGQTGVPVFVVLGFQASRLDDEANIDPSAWQQLVTIEYQPSDLVLLNHISPAEILDRRRVHSNPELIHIYRQGEGLRIAN